MKRYHIEFYSAERTDRAYGLKTYPSDEESVESIRKAIDKSNKQAIEKGYAPDTYTIIKSTTITILNDNGSLVMQTSIKEAVETYPNENLDC